MKKLIFVEMTLIVVLNVPMSSQTVVNVPSDVPPQEGNLNRIIDSVRTKGTLSNVIFQLELNSRYVLTDSIYVPAGQHLTIIAPDPGTTQETAPPQILCTSGTGEWGMYTSPINYLFYCYGDITLKNVWLFYANTCGNQVGVSVVILDDLNDEDGRRCNFENVIIDYSSVPSTAGGSITVACKKFKGFFKNCYWKNNTDRHFTYYGRAVSFPFDSRGWYGDSLVFENCTFANMGYVLMQEQGEYYNYVKFNHCTFFNVVMYPLESGWWNKLSVTNCIFVNTHLRGHIPLMYDEPYGATLRIDSLNHSYYGTMIYTFPYTEQDRRILFTNSSYHIEKWLIDWMWENPASEIWRVQNDTNYIPRSQPILSQNTLRFFDSVDVMGVKVFPLINRRYLFDTENPRFILPPCDTTNLKNFLYHKWWDSEDKEWAWEPDNSINQLWPLKENLAYTNDTLKTAGIGGFPLGDLYRWWPMKYQQWKAQEDVENDSINKWLYYGFNSTINVNETSNNPNKFVLYQNYPNPFNPKTIIRYEIPNVGTQFIVSLKVYDILGREVATLVNQQQQAGSYEVTLDGNKLASGVYLYQLRANDYIENKKLVLLK